MKVLLLSRGGYIGLHTMDFTIPVEAVVEGTGYSISGAHLLAVGACPSVINPDKMYFFYPKEIKIVEDDNE